VYVILKNQLQTYSA